MICLARRFFPPIYESGADILEHDHSTPRAEYEKVGDIASPAKFLAKENGGLVFAYVSVHA